MAQFSRFNGLDQSLDILGSFTQSGTRTLTDETSGFGAALSGQTGSTATVSAFAGGVATLTGLTGMSADSVGNFLTVSGAGTAGNNGTFMIVAYHSATSVDISNSAGAASDGNNGAIAWTERHPYTLNDDLDFERSDRQAIKGVNYDQPVPVYQRPTAVGTNVPANLANIAGKTTDAKGFVINRKFSAQTVAATDTVLTISSAGNLKHADAVNKTGVPCFDVAPYTGNWAACYVEILRPEDGTQMQVQSGAHAGEKIIGITQAGASTSPDSVEVKLYSVDYGGDISTATAYTWEAGQPTSVDLFYGYFTRLDQMDENDLRSVSTLGVEENGNLRQDINDVQGTIGMLDGETNLSTHLTNTGNYYVFTNLPDATPSVVEALNTINAQIGNRDYTGTLLTDGQTISQSLQSLSDAVASSSAIRYIERLSSAISPNTAHSLPGGATYTLDGTGNGRNMWVYIRGLLRDPGSVITGDDYAETSSTSITPFSGLRSGDHINYIILA